MAEIGLRISPSEALTIVEAGRHVKFGLAYFEGNLTMAFYKYPQALAHSSSLAFDHVSHPGTGTPHSGIYRCVGCGINAASVEGHPLPPQNHHQHSATQGAIRWQLIVATH
ncbi:hypothetical protein [Silvimonas sp.]|uniref:hypothetical protein n=1 Tax=Silvimonas sp. TaxID=2650811 RepID=UPI002840E71C|nr:hypothetical protein [Silvimonas sp.]MDR3427764.1 hypothetical protein [Silvimonas sp.]